jgi:predicted HTH domain antitoxin
MLTVDHATIRIELDLPSDVLFAMRSFGQPDIIQQKVKTALALLLFQEDAISLGKAAEVAGMNYGQFLDVLQTHGIAAYDYSVQELTWDNEAVTAYQQMVQP